MNFFLSLCCFSILLALHGSAAPLKERYANCQFESPDNSSLLPMHIAGHQRSEGLSSGITEPDPASSHHTLPRSLSNTPSGSVLLIGICIGVVATLSAMAIVSIIHFLCNSNKKQKAEREKNQIPLRPSAPSDFRHLEHFTTSLSAPTTTAAKLRVAQRRSDGSWAFTDAVYDREHYPEPDPIEPPTPVPTSPASTCTTFSYYDRKRKSGLDPLSPYSSMPYPVSRTSLSSDATFFPDNDASSSKTVPPPYGNAYIDPTPVPPLPFPLPREVKRSRSRPSKR